MTPGTADEAVAIVGMAVLLPGAPDLSTYWSNLVGGVDAIGAVPTDRWDPAVYYDPASAQGPVHPDRLYCQRGGFISSIQEVDVTRFGIPPSTVEGTEPDQLLALSVAARALEDAGGRERFPDPNRVAVVLGKGGYIAPAAIRLSEHVRGSHQLARTLHQLFPDLKAEQLARIREVYAAAVGENRPENAIGLVSNLVASRIANRLGFGGPAYTVDGACASSLLAVDHAVTELVRHRCDVALAGGVHHVHDASFWSVFAQMRALSRTEMIRPFDRRADGTLIGEGTGVVVLKRLYDAREAGNRVYAVLRGIGVSSDGRGSSLVNPDPRGQIRAVEAAWRSAGVDPAAPDAVGMIEAHGTATPAGDAAELTTLARVFGTGGGRTALLGSVKSMIGHTMPAAGMAGLIKAALAVHHGVVPPTLHCEDPHPALGSTRFRVSPRPVPWPEQGGRGPRRAGVNAFGFGGINAHLVVEQADHVMSAVLPPPPPAPRAARPARLALGAPFVDLQEEDVGRIRGVVGQCAGTPCPLVAQGAPTASGSGDGPALAPELDRHLTRLRALPDTQELAAEFSELYRGTLATAELLVEVVAHMAVAAPPPEGTAVPAPTAPTPVVATPAMPVPPPAPPLPAARHSLGRPTRMTGPTATSTVLRVGLAEMPYLRDHTFFRQPADWPVDADRWPVMPATTVLHHMVEAVAATAPGITVTVVRDLVLRKWLVAAPPVNVPLEVRPLEAEAWQVRVGDHASARVEGHGQDGDAGQDERATPPHGAFPAAPQPWRLDRTGEWEAPQTAEELYARRLMFHGPAYQGVHRILALGPAHIRGVLRTPPAPGALLDNAGQLFGYWIITTNPTRTRVLPARIRAVRFFGPHPAPGTLVTCDVRVVDVRDTTIEADMQLRVGERVWAQVEGWVNRRFDNDHQSQATENWPEYRAISELQDGGWVLLHERWSDPASQAMIMRNHLGQDEREEFEARVPAGRRQWLLGRIAVKDAVRHHLWDQGQGAIFPAEIRVGNEPDGRPVVRGVHGRVLPDLRVSLSHSGPVAVALVREAGGPRVSSKVGIDVEEVRPRDAGTGALALAVTEQRLLEQLVGDDAEAADRWFTRFWAAKEAVGKADGRGLQGAPRRLRVIAVDEAAGESATLRVWPAPDGPDGGHPEQARVRSVHVRDVRALPSNGGAWHVVAWTTDPGLPADARAPQAGTERRKGRI